MFEDANGKLLKYFHGMHVITSQIFKSFLGAAQLRLMAQMYITGSCASLLEQITSISALCKNAVQIFEDVVCFGASVKRNMWLHLNALLLTSLAVYQRYLGIELLY